ncbi:MAG: hypothetical protein JWM98_3354 [Thermoleophilia bacterium]|nr:hypothetical protein [Thermoleophilia bacterium]
MAVGCCGSGGAAPLTATPAAASAAPEAAPVTSALTGGGAGAAPQALAGAAAIGTTAPGASKGTAVGKIISATDTEVVMQQDDGTTVRLAVRPQDAKAVGASHLQSVHTKPGAPKISLPTETIGGTTYAVGPYKHAS